MSDVVLVDATTLIALGSVGRVDLLAHFDGSVLVPEQVADEVTTEPAETNMSAFLVDDQKWDSGNVPRGYLEQTTEMLGDDDGTGDAQILAGVLCHQNADRTVAVASDDKRVRTVARGLGATVTGTVGVVVRAVHEGMAADDAKDLIRDIDSHGLHMTGELREKAFNLIDDAADR
jgi:predicted nucleic acid-binding protein